VLSDMKISDAETTLLGIPYCRSSWGSPSRDPDRRETEEKETGKWETKMQ